MSIIHNQKVNSLKAARNFVADNCGMENTYLIIGDPDTKRERKAYSDFASDCFLYEWNKYYSSFDKRIIRGGTLRDIFYGFTRTFTFNEAKLYVDFLYRIVKEKCKTDKQFTLSRLRPFLKDILIIHKQENDDIDKSFDIDSYLNKLFGTADSNTNEKTQENRQTEKKLFVIKDREVTDEDMVKALKIDKKCYRDYIKDSEQFSPEQCSAWNKKNGYRVYTMLKDEDNNVLGYINAVPINDKVYADIEAGEYPDAKIDCNCIVKYTLPGEYNMYFASIAIDEDLQEDRNLFIPLFNGFLDKLINLVKEEDIVIARVIADAVTEEGKGICERLGMNKIKDTEHDNSTVYELKLYPPNFKIISPNFKELFNLYKKRFEQLNKED